MTAVVTIVSTAPVTAAATIIAAAWPAVATVVAASRAASSTILRGGHAWQGHGDRQPQQRCRQHEETAPVHSILLQITDPVRNRVGRTFSTGVGSAPVAIIRAATATSVIVPGCIIRTATATSVIVSGRIVRAASVPPMIVSGRIVRATPPAVRSAAVIAAPVSPTFAATCMRGGNAECGQAGQAGADRRNGKNGSCDEDPGKRDGVNLEHLDVLLL